ncbi:MAG: single-stranded DNA-binding protein [Clostridia bacterium]|nr:single-stranded DNA-binding protein [Clostridia bacterium]
MNKVFLVGNLTRDPELSTVGANNASVCRFAIAVNRRNGGNKETDFYNITAWRALGENCAKFIKKGSKVAICGDIQIRNYEDKEGNKRTSVEVTATEVEFCDRKGDEPSTSYDQTNNVDMKPIADDSLPF